MAQAKNHQESKQPEGANNDSNKIVTHIHHHEIPKTFVPSNHIKVQQSAETGTYIEKIKSENWHNMGLDYQIDPKMKARITVKALTPRKSDNVANWAVGFASKDTIRTQGM